MKLKDLQNKYPNLKITKSNSSYGNYCLTGILPNHFEFFFRLKDVESFIVRHREDLKNGERL